MNRDEVREKGLNMLGIFCTRMFTGGHSKRMFLMESFWQEKTENPEIVI